MATRQAYGKTLIKLGEQYPDLVVMDADLSKSTQTAEFGKTYPERFFNMGIAEQNLYATAAGIALSGKTVCASTFAMFAAGRAFEIIRNSIGYTKANVKICATHAGITVGEDGASHQTFEDIALMRTIPGMTVINPSDGVSAAKLLEQAVAMYGPCYVRLGRAAVPVFYKESDEITRKLSLKSSEGGYKVTIVWLPEKLHEVCANKLLKLLEEPPEKTIFLLISEAPEMILPTILSRTQRFNIPKIEEADIAEALQQKYGVQPRDSETIAHLANGDFIKALETIHLNEENELFFNLFISLMRLSYQRKIREMKQWSEQLAAMGRERQKNFLEYCQRMIRENFIYNLHRKEMNYMTLPEQNFATRFAPFVNERNVIGIMDELSEAQIHIEQNVNARMVFFDFSLKMIVLLKQ